MLKSFVFGLGLEPWVSKFSGLDLGLGLGKVSVLVSVSTFVVSCISLENNKYVLNNCGYPLHRQCRGKCPKLDHPRKNHFC